MAGTRDVDDTHDKDDTQDSWSAGPGAHEHLQLVERVRRALLECAARAHEDAGLRGLCCEGAWEATVSAMRQLDLRPLLTPPGNPDPAPGPAARPAR